MAKKLKYLIGKSTIGALISIALHLSVFAQTDLFPDKDTNLDSEASILNDTIPLPPGEIISQEESPTEHPIDDTSHSSQSEIEPAQTKIATSPDNEVSTPDRLQSIQSIRSLSPEQAAKGHPVKVEAVVTFSDFETGWNNLFVEDETDGIYVAVADPEVKWSYGDRVEVTGVSAPGDFAPIIEQANVTGIGEDQLPDGPNVNAADLFYGNYDSRFVTVEGVVRSVERRDRHLYLKIANESFRFSIMLPAPEEVSPDLLNTFRGARVRAQGVCATEFNLKRQLVGIEIRCNSLDELSVVKPGLGLSFDLPPQTISSLFQFSASRKDTLQVRLDGIVTFQKGARELYMTDGQDALEVRTLNSVSLAPGDRISVVGFPDIGNYSPVIEDALVKKSGRVPSPEPVVVTAEGALSGDYDGQLVQMEATVVDITQGADNSSMLMQWNQIFFNAHLNTSNFENVPLKFKKGSVLSLSGICVINADLDRAPKSFELFVRNAGDIRVLREPTWWTAENTFLVTGALFIILTAVAGWVMMLRSKVREQTGLIRSRLEKEAILQTKYKDLFENSNDIFFRLDKTGRIISLNPTGERITGYSEKESEHLSILELAIDPGKKIIERIINNPSTDEHNNMFELVLNTKSGEQVALEMSAHPFFQGDECAGIHGIARDITERRQTETQLELVNKELVDASRRAGMAEVATGVLHNVGNVLNSINVSASVISDKVNKSRASNLVKVVNLINDNAKVPDFLTEDPKGKQVPGYLTVLVDYLNKEREEISTELELLSKNIQHIKDIVSMQQAYANVSGMHERVRVEDLVEDAIQMNMGALSRHEVKLVRDYQVSLEIVVDKPKVLQVLVNLIRNAKYACDASDQDVNLLTISIKKSEYFHAAIEVNDNGDGIPEENLTRIFQHGFTTRKKGNGFGLHSAALAVKELGGLLTAMSDGPGQGATFVLELPEKPPSDEP